MTPRSSKRPSSACSSASGTTNGRNTPVAKSTSILTAKQQSDLIKARAKAAWNSSTRISNRTKAGTPTVSSSVTSPIIPKPPSSSNSNSPRLALGALTPRPTSQQSSRSGRGGSTPKPPQQSLNSHLNDSPLRYNSRKSIENGQVGLKAGQKTNQMTVRRVPPQAGAHKPRPNPQLLRERFEMAVSISNRTDRELRETLKKLRMMILRDGLPEGSEVCADSSTCSLRGRVWKLLLGIYKTSSPEYISLIELGKSSVYDKIKNDTFRTLKNDKKFRGVVDDDMLSRVLNAFIWKTKEIPSSRLINLSYTYVQGMNVLLAPIIYVMPELDAFYTFTQFITTMCPLYVQPALEGVHFGLKLVDRCLKSLDLELWAHFKSRGLAAKVWAMPSLLTFSACTPPLNEILKLWDFYFAYGIHLNVLAVVAQLQMIRGDLLQSKSPMKLLRTFPPIQASRVISLTLNLIPELPNYLYDLLVRHTYDPTIDAAIQELDAEDEEEEALEQLEQDQESLYMSRDNSCEEINVEIEDILARHRDPNPLAFNKVRRKGSLSIDSMGSLESERTIGFSTNDDITMI